LPGLARNGADFETMAASLAQDPQRPRRVVAIDSRGRGQSEYDRNPANYSLQVELNDVIAVLTALGVGPALFIGTSRGGILTMMLAAVRPTAIAAAVLNDIGPVIDPKGLARIKSYIGKVPQAQSYEEAADTLRRLFGAQFPRLEKADWLNFARAMFKEERGRLVPDYDPKIAKTLEAIDVERPLPALWKEFDSLLNIPVMVLRGENSDILSVETVDAMRARHPKLETVEVAGQGHAPLLADQDTIGRIAAFAASCDRARRQ
jgi:pimeloyl-ACP methyl ester carboxylesterase